jgi:putative hemolysin
VFNLEIGEGLQSSYEHCRDEDEFDPWCHHSIVSVADSGEVVGTYRMQTHPMARAGRGFYSAEEFDLSPLAPLLPGSIELGRACIAREHRNQRVLFLLWRGLAHYVSATDSRYFFGCCSVTGLDPQLAQSMHAHLVDTGHLDLQWHTPTREAYRCPPVDECDIDATAVTVPPLMQLYLDYGARIISPPALDDRFNTIDFLALFDVGAINPRIRRMFFD